MGNDLTIGRWLSDRARGTPGRTAIEWRDERIGYAALFRSSLLAAAALRDAGVGAGERVAVLAGNCPEYVAIFFACAMTGVVVVPLNWRQSPAELAFQLDDAECSLLVAEQEHEGLAHAACGASASVPRVTALADVVDVTSNAGGGGARSAAESASDPGAEVHDDTPLFIVYTSGTTGHPKGAVLTHANVFWANLCFDRTADVTSEDVVLQVLPQFHVGGWNCQPLLAWWKGATVVLERSFDPERVLHLVAERRVTTMMGVPANYQFLAAQSTFDAVDLSSLRYVLVGGAPMPEALLRRWQDRGVRIIQGYGLTEAAPNVLCLPAEEAERHLGFAGKPYPHVDVALCDPAMGELLEGEATGELVVRGPNVFAGYWRNPQATADTMRGGWLHTGDVAERDAGGFYRIKDRLKDMYVSGGENVYPAEVETVLTKHPAIAEAAVVAVPDERWGEAGMAVVVVRHGASIDEEAVRAWCSSKLARYKVPREVRFVDALPRSAMQKVAKRELRARLVAQEP